MRRRGLLGIEGLAVGAGLDPDRRLQPLVLSAIGRRIRDLLRQLSNQLESGLGFSIASDGVAPEV